MRPLHGNGEPSSFEDLMIANEELRSRSLELRYFSRLMGEVASMARADARNVRQRSATARSLSAVLRRQRAKL